MLHIFLLFYYRSGALLTEFSSMGEEGKVPALTRKIMNTDYVIALSNMVRDFYDFAILESSENFLMSDQYVSTVELEVKARFGKISNRHMGLKETIILIPITSSYYAAYWNTNKRGFFLEKDSINRLDKENLKLVNKAIINNSYTKCIGAKKSKIEQTIDNYKDRRPSQIFAGGNPTGYSMGAIKKKEVFLFEQDDKAFHLFRWNPSLKKYEDVGRNDLCPCGSDKKFKKCHTDIYRKAERISRRTFNSQVNEYVIEGARIIEYPVDSWSGFTKK